MNSVRMMLEETQMHMASILQSMNMNFWLHQLNGSFIVSIFSRLHCMVLHIVSVSLPYSLEITPSLFADQVQLQVWGRGVLTLLNTCNQSRLYAPFPGYSSLRQRSKPQLCKPCSLASLYTRLLFTHVYELAGTECTECVRIEIGYNAYHRPTSYEGILMVDHQARQ